MKGLGYILCCHNEPKSFCLHNCACLKSNVDNPDNCHYIANEIEGDNNECPFNMQAKILFYTQIAVLTFVIIVSMVHLSIQNGDQTFWTGTLSTAIGISLPQPKFLFFTSATKFGKKDPTIQSHRASV